MNNSSNSTNPYVHCSPVRVSSSSSGNRQRVKVFGALSRCGKRLEEATRKAEVMADNLWNHLKTSPSLSEAAMARIVQGTKIVVDGGYEKAYKEAFGFDFDFDFEGRQGGGVEEKLLHTYACYLSTAPSGPLIGTLFISNKRIAFCSDFPLTHYSSSSSSSSHSYSLHYKVVIRNEQLRTVNPCTNRWNPSEKYIHIVTRDGHEFWFMGFISYDKALKNLIEATYTHSAPS
ncbi:GEM-like protein 2 [Humulus lupulus]|uniref:GEM-like protein 2 n=1 Tax=Humulus lupulus TaxID=3486 RepID=UPI002B4086BC|nr:GEM-like protein 2 [Humulus lupulus]